MIEALGGEFDYEELFNDLDSIKFHKNELIKEYRLNTPNYPKY